MRIVLALSLAVALFAVAGCSCADDCNAPVTCEPVLRAAASVRARAVALLLILAGQANLATA